MNVVTAESRSWHIPARPAADAARRGQWRWLAAGLVLAFAIPFVLTDVAAIGRDLYYGMYVGGVFLFVWAWLRFGVAEPRLLLTHRWRSGIVVGLAFVAAMAWIVQREPATGHPSGLEFAAAIAWRGVVYGFADGLILSAFPIVAVFYAFDGKRVLERRRGKAAIGALALAVSLVFTAVYHLGYADFRGEKLRKPLAGDAIWSIPTLVTLSPLASPITHAGLHVNAVVHSYDTDTFLPPHRSSAGAARPELQAILDSLVVGPDRIAPGATAYVLDARGAWLGAAGVADVQRREAMPVDARMRLESVSKIWTGVLIHQLAEEGELRLSDSVERWLPGLLPYGDRITVAQLLIHTSGLIDNNDMASDPPRFIARVRDAELRAELTAVAERARTTPELEYPPLLWIRLAAWQPLRFEPGTDTHYSNIGFDVLGLLAERASGASIAELYDSLLIRPLGLVSTTYDPQGPIAGRHARGYRIAAGAETDATAWHGGIGAEGGVVASAADTGRFLEALLGGRIVSDEWVGRLRSDLFWSGGTPSGCGRAYGHGGAGAGFRTEALVSGDGARVAVLLLNGRGDDAADRRAASAIRELYCAA